MQRKGFFVLPWNLNLRRAGTNKFVTIQVQEANHHPVCKLYELDAETRKLQSTYAEDRLLCEVRDSLCPLIE